MFRTIRNKLKLAWCRLVRRPTTPTPPPPRFTEQATYASLADLPGMKREVGRMLTDMVAAMPCDDAMEFTRWLRRFATALDGYDLPEPSNN